MISVTNFVHLKDDQRNKFARNLDTAASEFIERKIKDYKEVLANIARSLSGGR